MDVEVLRNYDLSSKICEYVDPHLALIIIDFQKDRKSKKLYTNKSLLKAKYWLLSKTCMVDYRNTIYKELHDLPENEDEPGYAENRKAVVDKYVEAMNKADEYSRAENEAEASGNAEVVKSKTDTMDVLYNLALISYNIGSFAPCEEVLAVFKKGSGSWKHSISCLWGLLACEILMNKYSSAFEIFNLLKERIELNQNMSHSEALMRRAWLLHWSLFLFFEKGRSSDGIIDFFLQPQYLNTISIKCPWLLRYLMFAIIVNMRRFSDMKEIIEIFQDGNLISDDPFVLFIKSLNINYDFEAAQNHLAKCIEIISIDYFIHNYSKEFIENARILITEMYFQIHHNVDMLDLYKKLNIEQSEGERWIAEFINNNMHMDAAIDAVNNFTSISFHRRTVYQQILEYTRGLVPRTSTLSSTLEKREQELGERPKFRA